MDTNLKHQYRFSILLSVCEKDDDIYLNKSLRSVLENSIQPYEIIIVVNGFISDIKENILAKYKLNNINFEIYRMENLSNFAVALNFGLKFVKTNWVMRQDPDDISDKYRFEKIMKKIKTGIDICGSNMIERSLFIPNDSYIKKVPEKHKDIMHYLKIRNPFSHPTVCINNKLFQNFKYPDLLLKEDYALWSNILSENNVNCYNIQEPLVETCNSINQIKRRRGFRHIFLEIKLQKILMSDNHIGLFRFISNCIIRGLALCMPIIFLKLIYKLNRKN